MDVTPRELTLLSAVVLVITLAVLLGLGLTGLEGAFYFAVVMGSAGWANFFMLVQSPRR